MATTNQPITDPEQFLQLSSTQLDDIFRAAQPGELPVGQGEGTAIIAPGTAISDDIARFVHIFSWKGKVFERDTVNFDVFYRYGLRVGYYGRYFGLNLCEELGSERGCYR